MGCQPQSQCAANWLLLLLDCGVVGWFLDGIGELGRASADAAAERANELVAGFK